MTIIPAVPTASAGKGKIWIDLDNSPHVPLFAPVIRELRAQGFSTLLTARDCFQVCELASLHQLECTAIGRHYGKHLLFKLWGLAWRACQLVPTVLKEKPVLAVSHGSRAQLLVCQVLRIPSVWICDYEFVKNPPFLRATWVMVPDVIPIQSLGAGAGRTLTYPGIKEDVYVPEFRPDPALRNGLGVRNSDIMVTVRPPATEAHYRSPKSDQLYVAAMEFLLAQADARIVMVPRSDKQAEEARGRWPSAFRQGKILIPERVVDGLNLIWNSDLVISGGGTMNREAAALRVPVYSTFGGRIGAVDRSLAACGRLVLLDDVKSIPARIDVVRRNRQLDSVDAPRPALISLVNALVSVMPGGGGPPSAGACPVARADASAQTRQDTPGLQRP